MRDHLRQYGIGYLVALGATVLAVLLQFALLQWSGEDAPFLPFVMATIAAAWHSGVWPGLFATALSVLALNSWFLLPTGSLLVTDTGDQVRLLLFVLIGLTVSVFNQHRLLARRRMSSRHRELEQEVTDERREGTAVRESEAHLRLALDAARMVTWDWNLTTGMCRRSENAAGLFGLGTSQAEDFSRLVHSDDRSRFESAVVAARSGQADYDLEFRIVMPDGCILWVLDKACLWTDSATQQPHLTGVCMDITERKRAIQEREQVLATLNSFIVSAPLGITLLDSEMRYQLVNGPLAEMNGIPTEDHIGKSVVEIVPDLYPQVEPIFRKVMEGGQGISDQIVEGETAKAPGIKRVWWEGWFPVTNPDGKSCGVGVIVQDITEQRQVEERLQKKIERLHLVSEAAEVLLQAEDPKAMLRNLFSKIGPHIDLDICLHSVVDETGQALELVSYFGIPDEIARTMERLPFGEAICGIVALRRQAIVAANVRGSDDPKAQIARSLGVGAYICNPLLAGNDLIGTLLFASRTRDQFDTSELEFLQTICDYVTVAYVRIKLIQQLQEADRRKDEFLAMLAHELRNPLAPIRSGLDMLAMEAGNHQETLALMQEQVEHVVRLVDDLLDASRIMRGKVELRREPAELAVLVKRSVEAVRPLIDSQGQELAVCMPQKAIWLNADPVRLVQVIENLLTNASKYTDAGGKIELHAEQQNDEAVILVRDTGIGIEPELLPKVFELFTQSTRALDWRRVGWGSASLWSKTLWRCMAGPPVLPAKDEGTGARSRCVCQSFKFPY